MSNLVRSPDIAEIRAFCAAVDLGSIGAAARLLRISQPGLSKRLRMLEALAGAPLLERSPRGVSPTPAGSRLYTEARRLLTQAEVVEELMSGLSPASVAIRVAASHTIAEHVLPGPLVEFEQRHQPRLAVELLIANSDVVRAMVREGRAELGLVAVGPGDPAPDGLAQLPFLDDEVVVAVPPDHAWTELEAIGLDELLQQPMILRDPGAHARHTVDRALASRGLALAPPIASVGSTNGAKVAALSQGVPLLISRAAVEADSDGFVVRRVEGFSFERQFAVVVTSTESLRPAARALVEHLTTDS